MKTLITFAILILNAFPLCAATFIVTNTNDVGAGTFRDAITLSNDNSGADVIIFNSNVSGTITLVSALPPIWENVDIQGPGADVITIDGNSTHLAFNIAFGADVDISGLRIFDCNNTEGGAFYLNSLGSQINISDVVFESCSAGNEGGAIYINAGTVVVENSTFKDNSAAGAGGAVFAQTANSSLTIKRCLIQNNTSGNNGGGVFAMEVNELNIENTTFIGNKADLFGGGLCTLLVVGCKITNCTIIGNYADYSDSGRDDGGGIYLTFGGTIEIVNTIIANNYEGRVAPLPEDFGNSDCTVSDNGYNIITENSADFNSLTTMKGVDPQLGALQDAGGPTLTCPPLEGSPCIDAATSVQGTHPVAIPSVDQRGYPRAVLGSAYDIGACEYLPPDADSDGIANGEENNSPNGGDANGDGTPDFLQSFVASISNGDNWAVVVADDGSNSYSIRHAFNTPFTGADETIFPFGATGYRISGVSGFTTVVRIYFFGDFDLSDVSGFKAYIKTPPDYAEYEWHDVPNPATSEFGVVATGETTIGGESCFYIDLRVTDNAFGDSNPVAGIIDDPIAPFVASASVPTIGEFGSAALIVSLLALGGWIVIRKNEPTV